MRPPAVRYRLRVRIAASIAIVLSLGGCGASAPTIGAERGPCRADGGCDPGLQCLSQVCVERAGAGCGQVGERAGGLLTDTLPRRPLLAALLGGAPRQVAAQVSAACAADAWSGAAQRCVLRARSLDQLEACVMQLPDPARAALLARLGGAAPLTPTTPTSSPTTSPRLIGDQIGPQCEAYLGLLDRYARCPALPPEAQASIAAAVTTARQSFASVPAEHRHLIQDGCRQAVTSMETALTQLGCR